MPIQSEINDDEGMVYTRCYGSMLLADFHHYIAHVWSDRRCYGYNELFNTTEGDWSEFDFGSLLDVASRAAELNTIDPNSKLAWIVDDGKSQALTGFYKAAKASLPVESRSLEAFKSRREAMAWLGKKG